MLEPFAVTLTLPSHLNLRNAISNLVVKMGHKELLYLTPFSIGMQNLVSEQRYICRTALIRLLNYFDVIPINPFLHKNSQHVI